MLESMLVMLTICNTFKIAIFIDCVNPFLFLFLQVSPFAFPSFNDELHRQSEAVYMTQPVESELLTQSLKHNPNYLFDR